MRPTGSLASDTSSVTLKSTDLLQESQTELSTSPPGSPISQRPVPPPATEINPWLVQSSASNKGQTKHEVAVSKESGAAEKSKNKLRKRQQKRLEEKAKAQEDASVDISMSTVMTLSGPSKVGESSKAPATKSTHASNGKTKPSAVNDQDSDSDVNSELEEQERAAARKGKGKGKVNGVKAFEQRDLVALAFAGDNVVQVCLHDDLREITELIRPNFRTLRMPNGAKLHKTLRRRSILHLPAGYVLHTIHVNCILSLT